MDRRTFNKGLLATIAVLASSVGSRANAETTCEVKKAGYAYQVTYKVQPKGYRIWIKLKKRGAFNTSVPFSLLVAKDSAMTNQIFQHEDISSPELSHQTRVRIPRKSISGRLTDPLYVRLIVGSEKYQGRILRMGNPANQVSNVKPRGFSNGFV